MAEMAEDPRRSAERRRALGLLAASPDGCTAAILLAHGFKSDRLVELINAGLASVSTEPRGRKRPGDASYSGANNGRRQAGARSSQGVAMTATMSSLVLRRASASRLSGEWSDDDFDVLCDGVVVGRIMKRPLCQLACRGCGRWPLAITRIARRRTYARGSDVIVRQELAAGVNHFYWKMRPASARAT